LAYNFQNLKIRIKLLKEYESIAQRVPFGNVIFATLMSGKKYDVIIQNGGCSRENNVRTFVSKQTSLSKFNPVTEFKMEKIHVQLKLSDAGSPNLLRWKQLHRKC
jgi:hypothetical protein